MLSIAVEAAVRCLLIALFLPFSALDKCLNFRQAVGQAAQAVASRHLAQAFVVAGFVIEVVMSLGVLTGIADRLAAFLLGGYCIITALLWKQFWRIADFKLEGPSRGRDTFWDFLKNLALAGGFLLLAFGSDAGRVDAFIRHPFVSSHPYETAR